MGVFADPSGLEIRFYNKEGTQEIRSRVKGKGQLHSLPRSMRLGEAGGSLHSYDLGSADWLTDVMVADTEEELKAMTPISTGVSLTSTCSMKVQVQWKDKLPTGNTQTVIAPNCVTLAQVKPGEEDNAVRLPTSRIYVFPEGTVIKEGHPFWKEWHTTIDYLQAMQATNKPIKRPSRTEV